MGNASQRTYRPGDEPAPGYQLLQFLGRGGFGEVWRATGPGGVLAAIKIIHDLDRKRGGKELKALRLLRDIRHPNLVPLIAFWLKSSDGKLVSADSNPDLGTTSTDTRGTMNVLVETATNLSTKRAPTELVIAMGLAEKSLFDRLQECRDEGWRGVPVEELLTYMEDAARAIDLLNMKHGIEHCDIKPQNILLLSGAAQVCDFGLAKMVGEVRETSMGAGTVAYGAPEILLGKGPTSTTDQYSLAISYVELRTGELPFASERISDVLGAKQDGTIDLKLLSAAEQSVIEKALAIDPAARFKSCGEMVKALRAAMPAAGLLAERIGEPPVRATTPVRLTRTTQRRTGVRRRRLLNRLATGAVLVGALLAGGAWLSESFSKNNEVAVEKLVEAEHALITAEQALERANHLAEVRVEELSRIESEHHTSVPPIFSETGPTKPETEPGSQVNPPTPATSIATVESTPQPPAPTEEAVPASEATAAATAGQTTVNSPMTSNAAESAVQPLAESAAATADNTQSIVESAKETATAIQQIAETTHPLSLTLDQLREQLQQADRLGGLIENPQSPADYYHNARQWESRSNYLKAREAYTQLFAFKLDVVDPYLRVARMLRIQEGRGVARNTFRSMIKGAETDASELALVLLAPDDTRMAELTTFVNRRTEFAPAVYELSREYSEGDLEQEKKLLEQFLTLSDQGQLLRHFFDHTEATQRMDEARRRLVTLRHLENRQPSNSVRLSAQLTNNSWIVSISIGEFAKEVWYRVGLNGEFESTGFQDFVDERSGSLQPRKNFSLPLNVETTQVFVKYTDNRGNERGPFELTFSPQEQRTLRGKQVLKGFPGRWISIAESNSRSTADFSHLLSQRSALREIRYSIDSDKLDQTFSLPAWSSADPTTIPNDARTYIELPSESRYLAVQLTFQDGETTQVQQFQISKR